MCDNEEVLGEILAELRKITARAAPFTVELSALAAGGMVRLDAKSLADVVKARQLKDARIQGWQGSSVVRTVETQKDARR